MPALQLTAVQTALVSALETTLENAFATGVIDNNSAPLLPALQLYSTLASDQKTSVKDTFKSVLSAFMSCLGVPGFTGTVALAKLTTLGANGHLTVVNGIITAYVAPT